MGYRQNKRLLPLLEAHGTDSASRICKNIALLEQAVSCLDQREQDIIRDLYYFGLTWTQCMARNYISANTLNRIRKKAITNLSKIFDEFFSYARAHA